MPLSDVTAGVERFALRLAAPGPQPLKNGRVVARLTQRLDAGGTDRLVGVANLFTPFRLRYTTRLQEVLTIE